MKLRVIAFGLLISLSGVADDCDPTVVDPGVLKDLGKVAAKMNTECPNQVDVADLCQFVAEKVTETSPGAKTSYVYQSKIYKAACVEAGDSPKVIQAKVQNFWNRYHDKLVCSALNSTVQNGHILKLAVDRSSTEFINDTVRRWRVNLNHVDSDKKTVLDFIDEERKKAAGTQRLSTLDRYYQIFRTNGAKYSSEI